MSTNTNVLMEAQLREVRAWRQTKLHHYILAENRKITGVSRNDHRIILRILACEARRHDEKKKQNRDRWVGIMQAIDVECKRAASIMCVAPDPYNGALAKLSSMMLWNTEDVRLWQYAYNENELARRKTAQTKVLLALKKQGGLFLKPENYPL